MRANPNREESNKIDNAYEQLLNDENFQKESARMRLDKLGSEEILNLYYSKIFNK